MSRCTSILVGGRCIRTEAHDKDDCHVVRPDERVASTGRVRPRSIAGDRPSATAFSPLPAEGEGKRQCGKTVSWAGEPPEGRSDTCVLFLGHAGNCECV